MAKSSSLKSAAKPKGAVRTARIVMGVLVVLNLVAGWLVYSPPGGSAESLEQALSQLQGQVKQAKARADETKQHAAAVEKGRGDAEVFLGKYFTPRRSASTALLTELNDIAKRAGIQDRGNSFSADLIEGSERLGMVTITANFEGTYRSLLNFVREIDRSESLLIIESLNAAPQQGSNNLMVAMKMESFIQEDGSAAEIAQAEGTQ